MITIYHNPRCRKSRAGLEYLKQNGVEPRVVDYITNPPTVDELRTLFEKLGKPPSDMVRTQEEYYRKELKGKDIAENEWLEILSSNPKLLQRPIAVKGEQAMFGQPPENFSKLL